VENNFHTQINIIYYIRMVDKKNVLEN